MNIKAVEKMLLLDWEMTRKTWNNKKYIKKARYSPIVDITLDSGKTFNKYNPSEEDLSANDWELYNNQTIDNPSLTE